MQESAKIERIVLSTSSVAVTGQNAEEYICLSTVYIN